VPAPQSAALFRARDHCACGNIQVGHIGPSAIQSEARAQRFPFVSSPRENLAEKKFEDEVQEEVMAWFKGQAADFYGSGIQKLVPRLNKCLDNAGDYVEK